MSIILDTQITHLDFSRPYLVTIFRILQTSCEPPSPREIWLKVNMEVDKAISRSKVIHFLDAAVNDGLIDFVEDVDRGMRYYLIGCMA